MNDLATDGSTPFVLRDIYQDDYDIFLQLIHGNDGNKYVLVEEFFPSRADCYGVYPP